MGTVSRGWRAVRELAGRVRGSVRMRVTLLAAGLFAVTLLVVSVVLLDALERSLIGDVKAADRAQLMSKVERLRASGIPPDASLLPAPGQLAVAIPGDEAGQEMVMTAESPDAVADVGLSIAVVDGEAVVDARRAHAVGELTDAPVDDVTRRLLGVDGKAQDYVTSGVKYGEVTFATASPLDQVGDTIAATRGLLWVIGPALVGLVVMLSWILVGRALRPVHAVTSQVASMGSDSLDERVDIPASNDEIAELARTMNSMLGRLEVSTSASRRLVSDASHELRTPVAVMRTELEVARRSEAPDWSASSDVLLGELDRLQGLVDDLLLLARGDERALSRRDASIDDLVRDAASRRRRIPIEVTLAEGQHVVTGDEAAISRALDHVVANAARHGKSSASIIVTNDDAGAVVVHVDDDGDGIPADQRDAVVRRFVRLDEGRDRDSGGAGLGLAVTSDVMAAHGGELRIDDAPIGGARLSLIFPNP